MALHHANQTEPPPVIEPENEKQDAEHGLDEQAEEQNGEGVDLHSAFSSGPGATPLPMIRRPPQPSLTAQFFTFR